MEEELGSASVREQLITAGIEELNAHGVAGFSLRRVAAACNISCAAPYKHFKNKEELIGAIFSYIKRQLEQHEGLNAYTNGAIRNAVKDIVGVQFRNMATLGGSIWGRFGFSDVLTVFLAMDCYVELYKGGIVPLEQFSLGALADRPISDLSGGQWQRTLLARAFVSNPDLLLLDEPETHLDDAARAHLYDLLQQYARQCAMVVVSHDVEHFPDIPDRQVWRVDGRQELLVH